MTTTTPASYVALALIGLMCSLPFLQPRHTHPITSFYSEWLALALSVAAVLALALAPLHRPLRMPRIAWTPIALAVLVLGQHAFIDLPYVEPSLWAAAYLVWAALLMIVTVAVRDSIGSERTAIVLAAFVLAGALLNALIAIVQYSAAPGSLEPVVATRLGPAVYGNLGQPNHFADQVALGVAAAAFLYSRKTASLLLAAAMCGVMLYALALSGSRSAWLYLLAIAAAALFAHRAARSRGTRRALAFALALLPAFVLVHGLADLVADRTATTTMDRWAALWAAPSDRLQLWREAASLFASNPWTGVGWGQFAFHHFFFDPGARGSQLTGLYNNAHNGVLQLLAETGLFGGAIVAGGVAWWVAGYRRILMTESGWWIGAAALVLLLHSMLEYPLWNAYFLGMAAVALAWAENRYAGSVGAAHARYAALTLGVLGAVSLGVLTRDYRVVEAWVSRAPHAERAPKSIALAPYADLAKVRAMTLDMSDLRHKLALTDRVMRYMPTGIVAYRHSLLLALSGDHENALCVARAAARHYPSLLREYVTTVEDIDTGDANALQRYVDALRALLMRQNTAASTEAQ